MENLLKKRFGDKYEFFSAGIAPISLPNMDPRSSKFLNDNSLLNQLWIMDSKKKVSDVLKDNSSSQEIKILDFIRYKVGEGV